jgi:hypothetical protein
MKWAVMSLIGVIEGRQLDKKKKERNDRFAKRKV